jgi:hypothetical protein
MQILHVHLSHLNPIILRLKRMPATRMDARSVLFRHTYIYLFRNTYIYACKFLFIYVRVRKQEHLGFCVGIEAIVFWKNPVICVNTLRALYSCGIQPTALEQTH